MGVFPVRRVLSVLAQVCGGAPEADGVSRTLEQGWWGWASTQAARKATPFPPPSALSQEVRKCAQGPVKQMAGISCVYNIYEMWAEQSRG